MISKRRCGKCKKKRTFCSLSASGTKFFKEDKQWKEVDGMKICPVCIAREGIGDPSINGREPTITR